MRVARSKFGWHLFAIIRLSRLVLLVLSRAFDLGLGAQGVETTGMDKTTASAPSSLGGKMGCCERSAGTMLTCSAVCDIACAVTVAIAVETPTKQGDFNREAIGIEVDFFLSISCDPEPRSNRLENGHPDRFLIRFKHRVAGKARLH